MDERYKSAKPISMCLSLRNSQCKAQDEIYGDLKRASHFGNDVKNKQKQLRISGNTRSKAALQEISSIDRKPKAYTASGDNVSPGLHCLDRPNRKLVGMYNQEIHLFG